MQTYPMEDLNLLDPKLAEACRQASATNSMTPLIKQELQLTILNRRHLSGQGDVEYEQRKSPVKRELTEVEIEKKKRRKEQNRRAAERCRIKKKKMNDKLNEEYMNEQRKSQKLEKEVDNLRKERDMLLMLLKSHRCNTGPDGVCKPILAEEYPSQSWTPSPPQSNLQNYEPLTPDAHLGIPFQQGTIKSEYQPMPQCPVNQPMIDQASNAQSDPLQYCDNLETLGDPFDEVLLYPIVNEIKPECQTYPPCPLAQSPDHLPDFDVLTELDIAQGLSPCSPGMMQGRVSISDYVDQ